MANASHHSPLPSLQFSAVPCRCSLPCLIKIYPVNFVCLRVFWSFSVCLRSIPELAVSAGKCRCTGNTAPPSCNRCNDFYYGDTCTRFCREGSSTCRQGPNLVSHLVRLAGLEAKPKNDDVHVDFFFEKVFFSFRSPRICRPSDGECICPGIHAHLPREA